MSVTDPSVSECLGGEPRRRVSVRLFPTLVVDFSHALAVLERIVLVTPEMYTIRLQGGCRFGWLIYNIYSKPFLFPRYNLHQLTCKYISDHVSGVTDFRCF